MTLSLSEDINSVSHFKANFNELLKKLKATQRPLVLTQNGKSAGVFLDIETWEKLLKKIQVLKLINEGEISLSKDPPETIGEVEEYFNKKFEF